jgi:Protein of unknown function (DUF3108)
MPVKLLLALLVCARLVFPQSNTLPSRETLSYNIDWRLFNAGKASIEWIAAPQPRSGYRINLHLESTGFVSRLFKVEDDFSANLDAALCTQSLQITTHESNRQRETRITFDGEARKASYLERDRTKNNAVVLSQEIDVPQCVHDVVGGLFFIGTLNLKPGQSAQVPVSDGKKSVMAKVEAQQPEEVKTPAGTFKTVCYEIYLFNNALYKRPAHLNIWLTDDSRKLPVQIRVRMQFTIGTITLQLAKHE